ncbi:PAN domain protein [Cooperia oncophora]
MARQTSIVSFSFCPPTPSVVLRELNVYDCNSTVTSSHTTSGSPTTGQPTSEPHVTVPQRECSGSLKFLYTTNIDRETVDLLLNETTVSSGDECAQLCFDLRCGFAFYKPSDKLCRFSPHTEDVVDHSTCDVSSRHYKTTIPENEPLQITCVSCDNQAASTTVVPEKVDSKPPQTGFAVDTPVSVHKQPDQAVPPLRTSYPACVINFQLDEEADTLHFNHYEVEKVRSVNDCARICFRGRCAAAVYSPRRGECLLGADFKDSCSNADATIRYLKQEDVKIQCFRCSSPKHFEKELAPTTATTTEAVEVAHQEDRTQNVVQNEETPPPKTSTATTHLPEETSTASSSAAVGSHTPHPSTVGKSTCYHIVD